MHVFVHVHVPNLHISLKEHLPEREFDKMESGRGLVDGLVVTRVLVMRNNVYIIEIVSVGRGRGKGGRERVCCIHTQTNFLIGAILYLSTTKANIYKMYY
jgi:hypothetical protein